MTNKKLLKKLDIEYFDPIWGRPEYNLILKSRLNISEIMVDDLDPELFKRFLFREIDKMKFDMLNHIQNLQMKIK